MNHRIVFRTLLGLLPVSIAALGIAAETPREPLRLTYLANAGVMLDASGSKILIDGLFDGPPPEYRAPEPEALHGILGDQSPFDGVSLVLVTHNHPDHFAAPLTVRFLESHPRAWLAAPADAVAEMRKSAPDWAKISDRLISFDIKVGGRAQHTVAGTAITAFRTLHSGKREDPMNVMYIVEVGGWRIFHEGDSDATFDEYLGLDLAANPINLALVHFWWPLNPETARLLQEKLAIDHVGLTHLPIRLEGDAPGKIDMVRKHYADIRLLLRGMPEWALH